jgi:uncharacterized protein (DUF2062 family)
MNKIKNWLYQKGVAPIIDQLKQGVSPEKLAASFATGILIGIFPLIGVSTGICLIAAYFFRLNHLAIQVANYAAYPLQFLLLIPFYRAGEMLFQRPPIPLDLMVITSEFKNHFVEAMTQYGMTGLRSVVVWIIIFPPMYFFIYYISKNIFHFFNVKKSMTKKK